VLEILLPQRCVACGASGTQLCGACLDGVRRLDGPRCERCGAPTLWPVRRCAECHGRRLAFATARAAAEYDGAVKAIVAAWKERGLRRLAVPLAALVEEVVPRPPVEALAFVPGDGDRSRLRGHHPAQRLAAELGRRWALPVAPLLARTRRVSRQRGLTLPERRRNVARAFRARASPLRVCLVDDVYTTGATANAAASALRAAGARRVEVVTFARAIR
jgi:predicted amidophosphoribosyltransferase